MPYGAVSCGLGTNKFIPKLPSCDKLRLRQDGGVWPNRQHDGDNTNNNIGAEPASSANDLNGRWPI